MKARTAVLFAVVLISVAAMAQTNLAPNTTPSISITQTSVDQTIAGWPMKPKEAVQMLVSKYGLPNEITTSQVMWHNNGVWKHTIVYRDEVPHSFPKPHTDFLEQVIAYRVPADKFDDLAAYDGSVIVERTKGEISARCDKEELNMLALNLANDVITGKRTVNQARSFYADTAKAFLDKGELRPYTQALQFTPASTTADMDAPFGQPPTAMFSSSQADETANDDRMRMRKD